MMEGRLSEQLEYIYEDEMMKLEISVDEYVSNNKSKGVSQMIGRRYGNLWERLVKCTFENSNEASIGDRVYYKDYVNKWIEENVQNMDECCKRSSESLLRKFLEENTGTDTQDLCDFTFSSDGVDYAVDTKVRFISNDSNTVREIANSAHHLKYMGYVPVLLFRKDRAESISSPIKRFEREGWIIECAEDSGKFIEKFAGNDLEEWIQDNIDVWERLKKYQEGLKRLRFDEPDWKF